MTVAFIGVGSSINPEENVPRALQLLARNTVITGISTFYRTGAIGRPDDPDFYNGVIRIRTATPPLELKKSVLGVIETSLGRVRTEDTFEPRVIDLDLLLYDDVVMNSDELVLPDNDIYSRAFISIPLCELEPDLHIPGSGTAIKEIASRARPDSMAALADFTGMLKRRFGNESGEN